MRQIYCYTSVCLLCLHWPKPQKQRHHSWLWEIVSTSVTCEAKLMKCLRLNTKGKPCCLIATKTVWAFTFAHLRINLSSVMARWNITDSKTSRTRRRLSDYIGARTCIAYLFGSLIKTTAQSWQCLPPNSVWPLSRMQWNRRKRGEKKELEKALQTKWEAQAPRSYLISINGFTGDPRDPRKSLRGGFSRSCL